VSAFNLIEAEKTLHSVPVLCRMLGVSRSGYYSWRKREPSDRSRFDAVLTQKIEQRSIATAERLMAHLVCMRS